MQFEFCQHFAPISSCLFPSHPFFFFSLETPSANLHFLNAKQAATSPRIQYRSVALAPVTLGTSAYGGQSPACLVRLPQSTLNFGPLGEIRTLTH